MKSQSHYKTWLATQYFSNKIGEIENIPSFSAMNSFLHDTSATKTKIAFTPILPYVAKKYDTIHTVMCNFQDVLLQKSQSYGPLWCNEGVYRLAKELQLLDPARFDNIFLGLGGFYHCDHYVRGIRGMAIVSEVLYSLLLDQFLIEIDENTQNQIVQQVKGISQLIRETNNQSTNTEWEKLTTKMKSLGFDEFNENRKKKSEQFLFWHNFISKVFPVLRDLTCSHREGD